MYAFLVSICLMTALCAGTTGFAQGRESEIRVRSEYRGSGSIPGRSEIWEIRSVRISEGKRVISFYSETSEDPLCSLVISSSGGVNTVAWQGKNGLRKNGTEGFLMVPGYPAPCDRVPVFAEDDVRIFEEKTEAGGRTFISRYQVSSKAVSPGEARANNWVRDEFSASLDLLRMVTVADRQGQLVVRQLWPMNAQWWIYEETPDRQSRVIDQ